MNTAVGTESPAEWKPTACILCECNCGILVRLGGEDGRRLEQIRGDKAHPASKGYTCQKALRLDHYQNGRGERVLHPLRKRADGSFEEIDWDTAIAEVAARLAGFATPTAGRRFSTTAAEARATTWAASTAPPR
jgi:anaerobic selenocysteine-containing dehydrogenase